MAKGFTGTPNEARLFLDRLMRDGVVTATHLQKYQEQFETERETLLKRLADLGYPVGAGAAAGAVVGAVTGAIALAAPAAGRAARRAGKRAVRKAVPAVKAAAKSAAKSVANAAPAAGRAVKNAVKNVTGRVVDPARAAIQKLQGRYLGLRQRIPSDVVAKRFGKQAIAERGKETVVREMEKYVQDNNLTGPAKRSRKRRNRK